MTKKLSFTHAVAVGLGNIIGAGIFVMAGSAIGAAGPAALVAFAITAGLAITVGLNTAELSSRYPALEGGVYSFARATMGDTVGFLVGWFRLIAYAVSGAAVALGFASYLVSVGLPSAAYYPAAVVLIVGLALVEVGGLRLASEVEVGLVVVKVVGLAVFLAAVFALVRFSPGNFAPLFPTGGLGVLVAANIAFFAYSGFNTIATLTPDVQDGERTVPRAIIASIVISTVLYVMVVFALLMALNWTAYGTASDPLAVALGSLRVPSAVSYAVAFAALAATFAVTLSMLIAGARTTKQMGEDGMLPGWFGKGSKAPALVVAGVMVASLGLGNVESVALVANFGIVFSYMLTGVQVAIARKGRVAAKFSSPGYPWVQGLAVVLSAAMLFGLGTQSILVGSVTLVAGLAVYWIYVRPALRRRGQP
ncbi:MAG: amino acid permease [Nitrososphaerota archaeon]|nr:amino acid permease [Nitrososphaerota archaeon]